VQNWSFEDPFVTGNGGFYQSGVPTGWTASGFSQTYIERADNGGFMGQPGITGANNQYIAMDGAGTLLQNLNIAWEPYTLYTVDMAGGHRAGFNNNVTEFGLRSSDAPMVDLNGSTIGYINQGALPVPLFDYASNLGPNGSVFTFQTGGIVPSGNLMAFITSDGAGRLHADSFTVTALAVPEPSSWALFSLGGALLLAIGHRRWAKRSTAC
jgi:hypothetical protein